MVFGKKGVRMSNILNIIFGEVDFNLVTPLGLLCVYLFALVMECIASVVYSTFRIGGNN